ncbi:DUF6252 family protein [Oceanihabitans sp. 2_MG-2023]|uniref:DUF6252 family protein n=1 Tax=Oceanihabitans sp. 2_MG-2023 TaxID=3062661 RepID=UPI0026E38CD4|nr:DUF6252 family protein [Oceanihabitans sp. 2_MG-2023]MDO6595473.1 DUF6252 family protein [Oceanihabitans sp. 2_MG-2023]
MKKIFVFIFSAFLVLSCGEDIQFNTPAIQAEKDGSSWRAEAFEADIDFGAIVVRGRRGSESIWLLPDNDNRDTYVLGENNISEARYVNAQGVVFSTKYAPDPSVQIYPADGQIVIESFDTVDGSNAVTGTFWFNAFTEDGLQKVNFSQGVFYRVVLSGGLNAGTIVSCDEAVTATTAALAVYEAVDNMSSSFPPACNAYKAALMQQITSCGDDTNTLQNIIDGLDCVLPCDVATANTDAALVVYDNTDASSTAYPDVCNEYKLTLEQQIESCGDTTGDLQVLIDGLDCN